MAAVTTDSVLPPSDDESILADGYGDEEIFADLDDDFAGSEPPRWRRPLLIAVAVITVVAMAMLPLYNVIGGNQTPVAENGLEVCGFDYCVIQDVMRAAGLDLVMSRLSTTFITDDEAAAFAETLLEHVGEPGVSFQVVDRLEGDIEGQYSPDDRAIQVERPARAWIVLHEVAHVGTDDHEESFQRRLVDLTRWVDSSSG